MAIVSHVDPVETLPGHLLPVLRVGGDRPLVRLDCLLPLAEPQIDVRRHVDQVAQTGGELAEPVGDRGRLAGLGRRFHGMNVEVQRERVVGRLLQDRLESLHHLRSFGPGLAVRRPEVPRPQVHQRLGEESADVAVLGEALVNVAHRRGIGLIEGPAILRLRIGIALGQCLDEGLLDLGAALRVLAGAGKRGPRRLRPLRRHQGEVDVRAVCKGHSPVCHRALGVERGGVRERPDGLVVVESKEEVQPLVEVRAGLPGSRW